LLILRRKTSLACDVGLPTNALLYMPALAVGPSPCYRSYSGLAIDAARNAPFVIFTVLTPSYVPLTPLAFALARLRSASFYVNSLSVIVIPSSCISIDSLVDEGYLSSLVRVSLSNIWVISLLTFYASPNSLDTV